MYYSVPVCEENELAFKCGTLYTGKIVCIYETEQQQSKIVPFVPELAWLTDVTILYM